MGSTDYLNSAKRAAMAFSLLALLALGGAGYHLAITAWSSARAQVAVEPAAKPARPPHRAPRAPCVAKSTPNCDNEEIALGEDGLAR